jgi:4-hydroxy 2-oxovalerate aldolase
MGIVIMDSAGASTPDMVVKTMKLLSSNLNIRVGFHAHNNMGLAVSNSVLAIENGATIIDATLRGFGAGAGNCQLEVLAGLMQKIGIDSGLDLYRLMDVSEDQVTKMMTKPQEITSISLISGMAGVFSAFSTQVKKAAAQFKVDPRDIFIELGKRKIVGGQEDFIVDVAMNLAQQTKPEDVYELESLL